MPRLPRKKQLTLERLEARECPTLDVFYMSGSLFILGHPVSNSSMPGDGLNVTVTSDTGAVSITETDNSGATIANYGTYVVRNNLYIGLTDYNTNINVDTNGHRLFANLYINLGLGAEYAVPTTFNPISVFSSDTTNMGSIAGNVTVFRGSGKEYLSVGANALTGASGPLFEIDGNLNVAFPRTIDDSPGNTGDTLAVTGPIGILGNVNATGVDNVLVGDPTTDESVMIGGNLSVNNAGALNHTEALIYGSVAGNVSVEGSATKSDANPNRVDIGSGNVTVQVNGSVTLDQTEGSSSFSFGAGSLIQGGLSYAGLSGDDSVTLDGSLFGNAVVSLGGGNNMVTSNNSASFAANLQITAGNGNNDLSTFSPTIGGNLNLTLGSGANTFTFAGLMNYGTLTSNTGNGADSITISPDLSSPPFALTAHLGSGANEVAFDADLLTAIDIEFAPHVAQDTLTQSGSVHGPYTLVNYP